MRTLVWFRGKDLRVGDHAPLSAALQGGEVIPLFVLDPYFFAVERARRIPHRMQFLLESIGALQSEVARLGSRLLLVSGKSVEVVPALAARLRVDRVVAQRWCEPFARERDARVANVMERPFELFGGETLHELGTLRTHGGKPYSVFSAFARAFAAEVKLGRLLPTPKSLPPWPADMKLASEPVPTLEQLGIRRNSALLLGGEAAAHERLVRFLKGPAAEYHQLRDRLDAAGTSRLSADLKFGTLSARTYVVASRRQGTCECAGRVALISE